MVELFDEIVVVDPSSEVENWIQIGPLAEYRSQISYCSKLDIASLSGFFELGVVSNWGPDHARTAEILLNHGVPRLLVEKPVADSVADARKVVELAESLHAMLRVNYSMRYAGFAARLLDLSSQFGLGEIVSITVAGGARCLATKGVHYLDLANTIFRNRPSSVIAEATSNPINPRNSSLSYFEGVMAFSYPNRANFTCSFTNLSSVSDYCYFFWRDARGVLDSNGNVQLFSRNPSSIHSAKITHAGLADILLYQGSLRVSDPIRKIHESWEEQVPAREALAASEDLMGALYASKLRRSIALPVSSESLDLTYSWGIS